MKIKIKERDQDRLISCLRIHWDSMTNQYVGDMINFIDEILMQSGFNVICYHYDGLGCPISIMENKKLEKKYYEPIRIASVEIEEHIDEQLAIAKEDGSLTNIWYGKYSHESEIIKYIKDRYKHYFKLGLEELKQSQ